MAFFSCLFVTLCFLSREEGASTLKNFCRCLFYHHPQIFSNIQPLIDFASFLFWRSFTQRDGHIFAPLACAWAEWWLFGPPRLTPDTFWHTDHVFLRRRSIRPSFLPNFLSAEIFLLAETPSLEIFATLSQFCETRTIILKFLALFNGEGFWGQNISTESSVAFWRGWWYFWSTFLVLCENPTLTFSQRLDSHFLDFLLTALMWHFCNCVWAISDTFLVDLLEILMGAVKLDGTTPKPLHKTFQTSIGTPQISKTRTLFNTETLKRDFK